MQLNNKFLIFTKQSTAKNVFPFPQIEQHRKHSTYNLCGRHIPNCAYSEFLYDAVLDLTWQLFYKSLPPQWSGDLKINSALDFFACLRFDLIIHSNIAFTIYTAPISYYSFIPLISHILLLKPTNTTTPPQNTPIPSHLIKNKTSFYSGASPHFPIPLPPTTTHPPYNPSNNVSHPPSLPLPHY